MNDRSRTIKRFYEKHPEEREMELRMKLERWTGEIAFEYLAYVKLKKLKGSLKDGTLEVERG